MNDLSSKSIPTATPSGWHLQCLICGHTDYRLVPMQEHLMDCHNLSQQDLGQSKSLPDDMTASDFVVSLSTGESYLRMLRVEKLVEVQTDNILDEVQPTPEGVVEQLLADAGDVEPVTDEQIKETVGKAKAFLNRAKTLPVYIAWCGEDFWIVVNRSITGSFYTDELNEFSVTTLALTIARSLAEVAKLIGLQVKLFEVDMTNSIKSLMAKNESELDDESLTLEWILSNSPDLIDFEAEEIPICSLESE